MKKAPTGYFVMVAGAMLCVTVVASPIGVILLIVGAMMIMFGE